MNELELLTAELQRLLILILCKCAVQVVDVRAAAAGGAGHVERRDGVDGGRAGASRVSVHIHQVPVRRGGPGVRRGHRLPEPVGGVHRHAARVRRRAQLPERRGRALVPPAAQLSARATHCRRYYHSAQCTLN